MSARPAPGPAGRSRRRLRAGFLTALDAAAALICVAIAFGVLYRFPGDYRIYGLRAHLLPPVIPSALLAVCLSAPVAVRRRAALPALVVALTACLAALTLGHEITPAALLPLALVLYTVAVTRPPRVAVLALAATLAVMALQGLLMSVFLHGAGNAFASALLLIICWVVGYAVRQRRAYAVRLREQAATAAVTQERVRIARELHDVVAHSMTVVAVQAGFGEYVFDSQPTQARAALAAIQTVTRDALADMQRLLGVLRQAAPAAPGPAALAPAAGLADLDRLAAATAGAGVCVEIRRTGEVRHIPGGVDLSAFRIVQEALTNVVRHSGATTCVVALDYGPSQLSVEITDPGRCPGSRPAQDGAAGDGTGIPAGEDTRIPAGDGTDAPAGACRGPSPGAGHGLVGMAERVHLCGGQFSAGPLPTGGFGVRAHLPLPPAPAAAGSAGLP